MRNALISEVESSQLVSKHPDFKPGDTITVGVKIIEGEKTRIQKFTGLVISKKGAGLSEMFIVRKFSSGIGVERTFPLNSPVVDSIKVEKVGKVRRTKLYYMRNLKGKAARVKELIKPKN